MPTLIHRRSYYDHHEVHGGMYPFDQIVDVAGNAVNAIGNAAANVGRVVTAPVRVYCKCCLFGKRGETWT